MFDTIIPAVKNAADLPTALSLRCKVVFLLSGEILNLGEQVRRIQSAGKMAFVHFDLIEGLGKDAAAVRYVARGLGADGIVSSRANVIKLARAEGMYTVQRLFILDSASVETGCKIIKKAAADALEILPGPILSRVAHKLRPGKGQVLIAGGLLSSREEVEQALSAGAVAVSTSDPRVWAEYLISQEDET